MKKIISLFLCIGILLPIGACFKKTSMTWREQYDLGVRYLSEGNYQEAVIAFTAAIEIEPKEAELYIKLADAYIAMNDYDNAREAIMQGLSVCEDESGLTLLSNYLYELEHNADISRLLRIGDQGNLVTYNEINFLGRNATSLDYSRAKDFATQAGYAITEFGEDEEQHFYAYRYESFYPEPTITVYQLKTLFLWEYTHRLEALTYTPEKITLRDISMLDSLESVLSKLGFATASNIAEKANSAVEEVKGIRYSSIEEIMAYNDSFREKSCYSFVGTVIGLSLRIDQVEQKVTGINITIGIDGGDGYHYNLNFCFEEDHLVEYEVGLTAL